MLYFSTKAKNLFALKGILKNAIIADLLIIKVKDWESNKNNLLEKIKNKFQNQELIIRSSCHSEDTTNFSNAGVFKSILNVKLEDAEKAIEEVINSYHKNDDNDEVLIQNMLKNVICSGVVLSHDPNTSSPYRIYNYSIGSDTSSVTAGKGGGVYQQAARSNKELPNILKSVGLLMTELLSLYENKPIDFEFAITNNNSHEKLWLLQVRPLVLINKPETEESQSKRLSLISKKIHQRIRKHPSVMGKKTVFGVMPDWNPAEILGIRPRTLALSLYRELVTDSIWAYQRHNYGYRNLRSFPLMHNFFGLPYIDVRLSFNSFIPSSINDSLASKLVDHYIDKLLIEPELHDKIEFEIVHSCYTLDLDQRLKSLPNELFSKIEKQTISDCLRELTLKIIAPANGLWKKDSIKIDILKSRREKLLVKFNDPLEKIYWLIEDTKRYGTLPFAGLARAAFIAVQILKSFLNIGIFSQEDYDLFISNISTISKKLNRDIKNLDKKNFLIRYGHLRPGTYDILSSRYDEKPNIYFNWNDKEIFQDNIKPFKISKNQIAEITNHLKIHKLNLEAESLLKFIKEAIELRELSKFEFTRNLSDILNLIGQTGEKYSFNIDDLSHCNINTFKELYISSMDPKSLIEKSISEGKNNFSEASKTSLPPLITDPSDAWGFELKENQPNFITQKSIKSNVCFAENLDYMKGAIVCITNADPGYDWIFSHNIGGLITAWGGINSHMAIRAGELGLPAVIGAGDILYKKWSSQKRLHINCAGRYVEILL